MSLRIAFASTPVGALGSGQGGGVELTVQSLVTGLTRRGHNIEIYAPVGSHLLDVDPNVIVHEICGTLQVPAQVVARGEPISTSDSSVLKNMWDRLQQEQYRFDIIMNFAYDWLPMYLTPWMRTPVVHLVSMASLTDAMDEIIVATSHLHQRAVAMHSVAQAATFANLSSHVQIVESGVELENYVFDSSADGPLGFVGRISPEKGIDDVVAVAQRTGLPLSMWGLMQDEQCLAAAQVRYPEADVTYHGFLSTNELGQVIGKCRGLLVTSKWVEAFGNVVIEAMACGVPVISYRRGGPSEIIQDGVNGFIVKPDDIDGLVAAVARLGTLSRADCRQYIATQYSVDAFAQRVERWLVARCAN